MKRHGEFSTNAPQTTWLTENDVDRRMSLIADFWFTDPQGNRWDAPAQSIIDGASIPRALWTLIGSPYTGDYRRASIVHDIACEEAAGNSAKRKAADRMFFHACMAGGCSWREAAILYVGVRIGAWWDEQHPAYWKATDGPDRPRIDLTIEERRQQADFQLIAARVTSQQETEEAEEIEARTDAAAFELLGIVG